MGVKFNVEWSERAISDLSGIYRFLLEEWGQDKAEEFLDLAIEFEKYISKYPYAYIKSRKYRSCYLGLVHKNTTAVYKIKGRAILIVTLYDNRSNSKYR